MKQQAAKRTAKQRALAVDPLLVDEQEPDGLRGGNDTPATAQPIAAFGSAAGERPAARILGTLAPGVESRRSTRRRRTTARSRCRARPS